MDLSPFEGKHRVGGVGRAIVRLRRRDAGYRYIVSEHVPGHTVLAQFRRRHIDGLQAVFASVLQTCREPA